MKFEEALKALREGKKVKRSFTVGNLNKWICEDILEMKEGNIYYENLSKGHRLCYRMLEELTVRQLLSENWEIVE